MLEPLIVQPDELQIVAAEVEVARTEIATDATDEHLAGTVSLVTDSFVADELSAIDASLLVALSVVVDQLAIFGDGVAQCATDYEQADAANARSIQAVAE
ncbi:hypothetical protein [Rhodococcus sp. IEGM 1330]|uniref:hypothetical protein n=1 Tax=Rhodococcus sp. IEGM 1330 TaxID=3082225 RepID=UPI0029536AF8|nr:hypothetical protein [Rhodococcus sp. IEGM 1330]MDV8022204.1 hypothetical protein [Rhodococcus sp. IEGM 1330]